MTQQAQCNSLKNAFNQFVASRLMVAEECFLNDSQYCKAISILETFSPKASDAGITLSAIVEKAAYCLGFQDGLRLMAGL